MDPGSARAAHRGLGRHAGGVYAGVQARGCSRDSVQDPRHSANQTLWFSRFRAPLVPFYRNQGGPGQPQHVGPRMGRAASCPSLWLSASCKCRRTLKKGRGDGRQVNLSKTLVWSLKVRDNGTTFFLVHCFSRLCLGGIFLYATLK